MSNPEKSNPENRIKQCFHKLREKHACGLVTFLTAGDPNPETSSRLLDAAVVAGADMIELGMPFSDPMADGPAIQASSLRALAANGGLLPTLKLAADFRARHPHIPLILMGYYNPIHKMGPKNFAKHAANAGVDGLIIVDLPIEEEDELRLHTDPANLNWVRLMTPTSNAKRRGKLLARDSAFIYYVAIKGITGTQTANFDSLQTRLKELKKETQLPIAVGFGLRTPQDLKALRDSADAVVVGSSLVEQIANDSAKGHNPDKIAKHLREKISSLKAALS
ncbi:MAG: tryptophan synthase subunit alpha [Alphaproteobacteria bacterium]